MDATLPSRKVPWGLAIAGLALWLGLFWRGPLVNDVAWQLWIGERLNGGASLYRDILEINPPLWFWGNAGIVGLSTGTGIDQFHGMLIAFAATALLSLLASLALARTRSEQLAAVGGVIALLLVTSPYALGQREQFAILATFPYILLAVRRAEGDRIAPWLAAAVGLGAASGLLLKPYFLLVPLLLEAWMVRRRGFKVRPELLALGAAGAAYAAAILLAAPAYLTTMVPLIRLAYAGYDESLAGLLISPDFMAPLFLIGGCLLASRKTTSATVAAFLLAGSGFLVAALWQFKGFGYHFVPALGCALVAVLLSFGTVRRARPVVIACVVAGLFLIAATTRREAGRRDGAATRATAGLATGSTVLVLSESASTIWPLVRERDFNWPSRHMAHWMLAKVWMAKSERRSDPALEQLGERIVREAARDIERSRPAMLLFDRRWDPASGGIVEFFGADPVFAAAMRDYEPAGDVEYLRIYRRKR